MATAAGEEVPFVAGMEREEDCREITVTLDSATKKTWRLDAMIHRTLETAGRMLDKVRSLADRGPDPDYAESEFERGMKAGARLPGPNWGGVINNGSKLGWLITLNIAITLAVSGWVVKTIIDYGQRLVRIECRMDPQCVSVVPRDQP